MAEASFTNPAPSPIHPTFCSAYPQPPFLLTSFLLSPILPPPLCQSLEYSPLLVAKDRDALQAAIAVFTRVVVNVPYSMFAPL